jgi:hypothetical protein
MVFWYACTLDGPGLIRQVRHCIDASHEISTV